MISEVVKIPCSNLKDVPALLRKMANQIEGGEWGNVDEAIFVMARGSKVDLFLWGDSPAPMAHLTLSRALRKLET